MLDSRKAISGDNGLSVVGNDNEINIKQLIFEGKTRTTLNRSVLFDICKIIAELEIDYDEEYSIHSNSDWIGKLEYNNVNVFVDIFDTYSDGYDEVSKVLHGYVNKHLMVKKIRSLYLDVEQEREQEDLDGDFVLRKVFSRLKEEVCYNAQMVENELFDEQVDEAIYLAMFYTFTKCKLLKPIPKVEL